MIHLAIDRGAMPRRVCNRARIAVSFPEMPREPLDLRERRRTIAHVVQGRTGALTTSRAHADDSAAREKGLSLRSGGSLTRCERTGSGARLEET